MKRLSMLLLGALALSGCALSSQQQAQLQAARDAVHQAQSDEEAQHNAPKDLRRAEESLQRAEQLAGYVGGAEDAEHFAYLAQRYAGIAMVQARVARNQQRLSALELEQRRLRLQLGEARQSEALQRSQWLEQQLQQALEEAPSESQVLELGDGLFAAERAELAPVAHRSLKRLARFLVEQPQRQLRIEGYADARSDGQAAQALSVARAQAVADELEVRGVDARRLQVVGLGSAYPVAESASPQGRERNRRVELVLSDRQGQLPAAR